MFTIEMLPANHGDCLWIEYGASDRRYRVLVDGGPTYAYDTLKQQLEARLGGLPAAERRLELLVITHVDADHIGGILELLTDTPLGITFGDIWFNGWEHLPDGPGSLGPRQGELLSDRLIAQEREWNGAFRGGAISVGESGELPHRTLNGGLELTVLSPTLQGLRKLAPVWLREVTEAGLTPGVAAKPSAPPDEEREGPPGVLSFGRLDPAFLAALRFKEDTSVANGSSIALLAEFEGRKLLLGGDAHPSVLERSIGRLTQERGLGELPIDAFKVPHHGGRSNLSVSLLEQLRCRRYLVSTNGSIFKHPHQESVARIITHAPDTTLCFNYRTNFNQDWDDQELKEQFRYETVYPAAGTGGPVVELS